MSVVFKSMTSLSLLKTVLCTLSLLDEFDTGLIIFHLCINSGENCYLFNIEPLRIGTWFVFPFIQVLFPSHFLVTLFS